jgi:hypothetical protein
MSLSRRRLLMSFAAVLAVGTVLQPVGPAPAQTPDGGFVNKGLVGVGRLPADMKDKFGETFGSGSGVAVDVKSWSRSGDSYRGTFSSTVPGDAAPGRSRRPSGIGVH